MSKTIENQGNAKGVDNGYPANMQHKHIDHADKTQKSGGNNPDHRVVIETKEKRG